PLWSGLQIRAFVSQMPSAAPAHDFVIPSANITRVMVEALLTLKPKTSPAETLVVQPDRVVSWLFWADESVGGALATMVLATVGMVGYAAFHTSMTHEPFWSAIRVAEVIVPAYGHRI